ncbi:MAG: hypothetical protein ACRD1S_01095 [Vicinamibacterales bacterium]
MPSLFMLLTLLQAPPAALDNEYVRVTRDAAVCGEGGEGCRDRILVALDPIELEGAGARKRMTRGEIAVFHAGARYRAPAGRFLEVVIKPGHPAATSPGVRIPPDKNAILYDGPEFFVFEEKLAPGDTRARHSHTQRVVIVINKTRLQQWPDGQPEVFRDQIPDDVRFNPPVIHVVKTVGEKPLRNIVIEFKPPAR